jgi:hypothetical protein
VKRRRVNLVAISGCDLDIYAGRANNCGDATIEAGTEVTLEAWMAAFGALQVKKMLLRD